MELFYIFPCLHWHTPLAVGHGDRLQPKMGYLYRMGCSGNILSTYCYIMDSSFTISNHGVKMNHFRSEIAQAKGLGSAKSGTQHYIMQRVTAIALLPLTIWFVISAIMLIQAPLYRIPTFATSPLNLIATILFIAAFLYHGILGIKTIIEDYVHCKAMKYTLLLAVYFLTITSLVAGICSVFGMHMFFIIKMAG